ncbi:MAG: hypothetical protein MJY74_07800 [Bacteroidaceae bacterium]|nr:hypothetical protein [Bacteroidaceae bacterium]
MSDVDFASCHRAFLSVGCGENKGEILIVSGRNGDVEIIRGFAESSSRTEIERDARLVGCGDDGLAIGINGEGSAQGCTAVLDFDGLEGDVLLSGIEHYLKHGTETAEVHSLFSFAGERLLAVHRDGLVVCLGCWPDRAAAIKHSCGIISLDLAGEGCLAILFESALGGPGTILKCESVVMA